MLPETIKNPCIFFQCPLCSENLKNKRLVTEHFGVNHPGVGKTGCPECQELINPDRLRRHFIKKHHSAGKPTYMHYYTFLMHICSAKVVCTFTSSNFELSKMKAQIDCNSVHVVSQCLRGLC